MSEVTENKKPNTDDEYINYAQQLRVNVVDSMMTGNKVPSSLEEKSLMLKALNDLTGTSIANKRIINEEAANNNLAKLASEVVANIISGNGGGVIGVYAPAPAGHKNTNIHKAAEELPEFELVPGEVDINPQQEDVNDFSRRINKDL